MEDFFRAFAQAAAANVHLKLMYGRSSHHQVESMFKAFAKALRFAVTRDKQLAPRAAVHEGPAVKIAIVDYGAGNLPSVERALRGLGAETERAVEPAQLAAAKAIVLPGVGTFLGLRRRACANGISRRRCAPLSTRACRFSEFASDCRRCSRRARKLRATRASAFSRKKFARCRQT